MSIRLFAFFYFIIHLTMAQGISGDSVLYSREYQFKEGLYLNFQDIKTKSPIAYTQVVTAYPKDQPDFWQQILKEKTVIYSDKQGIQDTVKTNSIFALSVANQLYLFVNGSHARAKIIGSLICVATPKGDEYVYSTEERKLFPFDTDYLLSVFNAHDPELSTAYKALKKRDQFASRLTYLGKYNQKHPLYLSAK